MSPGFVVSSKMYVVTVGGCGLLVELIFYQNTSCNVVIIMCFELVHGVKTPKQTLKVFYPTAMLLEITCTVHTSAPL